jgi:hypothetical protein
VKAQYQNGERGFPFLFALSLITHGMSEPLSERFVKSNTFFDVFFPKESWIDRTKMEV